MKRTPLTRKTPLRRQAPLRSVEPSNLTKRPTTFNRWARNVPAAAEAVGAKLALTSVRRRRQIAHHENDVLAARLCKVLAGRKCERCNHDGSQHPLQWHHVVRRNVKVVRWEMLNSLCLCSACHFWWHEVAIAGEQWEWFERTWPGRKEAIVLMVRTRKKVDTVGVNLLLKVELRKLGEAA